MCILPKHEDSVTEFKLLWCDSAKKTLCAFLNGRGGTIWFGLNDAGEPIGLAEPDVVSNAVTNTFRGMHPDASAYFETHIEEAEGKPLVLVKVFPGKSTPYKVDVRGEGCRAYVRRGSSTYLASEEELLELTRQGDPTPWEAYPAREQNLTFEATRRVFERHYVEFSSRTEEILMLRARSNGLWTNLAYLLSDQNKFKTRFAIFNGLNKAAPIAAMLDAEGSILDQFERIYQRLRDCIGFSCRIGLRGERIERHEFPLRAVREALVNLCVHRDFRMGTAAYVAMFSDRLEFLTMGALPRGCDPQLLKKGISVCRNQALCDVFYRLDKMEQWGIGIPTIFASYEGEAVQPALDCSDNCVEIVLPRLNVNVTDITARQEMIMSDLMAFGRPATRQELQSKTGVSYVTLLHELKELVERGKVQRIGAGRNTCYKVL